MERSESTWLQGFEMNRTVKKLKKKKQKQKGERTLIREETWKLKKPLKIGTDAIFYVSPNHPNA